MKHDAINLYSNLPDTPGVYLMRDSAGKLLYVGKAGNLRRRVSSYFLRPHDARIESLVSRIAKIDHEKTDTAIEALILEAKLIKEHEPPYNIREKDDKSFLYVVITKEKCPRVLLVRGRDLASLSFRPASPERAEPLPTGRQAESSMHSAGSRLAAGMTKLTIARQYGPFTSASNLKEALKIIRRIFPYNTHDPTRYALRATHSSRPCFDYELGLCPGFCGGKGDIEEYRKNIKNIALFFEGKKERILRSLEKDMKAAAKKQEYEKAAELQRRIFALQHIKDIAMLAEDKVSPALPSASYSLPPHIRIEGYDISNISGTSAVGSMVVFTDGEPDKAEYRKFKIKTIEGSDDTGMLTEVLTRRFKHSTKIRNPNIEARNNFENSNLENSKFVSDFEIRASDLEPWPLPDVILIDGGKGQVNAARKVLVAYDLKILVVGLAKGPERKRNDLVGLIPKGLKVDMKTLIRVRDEAHRFAIAYHKKVRSKRFLE